MQGFLFFELWSFLYSKYGQFSMKPKPITRKIEITKMLFSTFRSFHKNLTTSKGWVCISLVRKKPKKKLRQKSYPFFFGIFIFCNFFPQNSLKRPRKNCDQNRSKILLKYLLVRDTLTEIAVDHQRYPPVAYGITHGLLVD